VSGSERINRTSPPAPFAKSAGLFSFCWRVFLHTTVDGGDHFQQILAWTLKSRWQQPRTLSGLREITGTFRSEK